MSGYSWAASRRSSRARPPFEEDAFQPFWDTYETISERYAGGDIDRQALVQGAIRGMVEALGDPFSAT